METASKTIILFFLLVLSVSAAMSSLVYLILDIRYSRKQVDLMDDYMDKLAKLGVQIARERDTNKHLIKRLMDDNSRLHKMVLRYENPLSEDCLVSQIEADSLLGWISSEMANKDSRDKKYNEKRS